MSAPTAYPTTPEKTRYDVVIIGGATAGSAISWFLSGEQWRVRLLERCPHLAHEPPVGPSRRNVELHPAIVALLGDRPALRRRHPRARRPRTRIRALTADVTVH